MADFDSLNQIAASIEAKLSKYNEALEKADDQSKTVAELSEKIAELGNQQLALGQKFLALQQAGVSKGADEKKASLGVQFVESESFKSLAAGQSNRAKLSAVTTPAGAVAPYAGGIAGNDQAPVTIKGAFETQIPVTTNSVSFIREKSFTNNAAAVAEGTAKPESDLVLENKVANVATIAHWIRVSKQLVDDAVALAAYIDARMAYGLEIAIDRQLVNGTGGTNVEGFFTAGSYTPHGLTAPKEANDTVLDLIRYCKAAIEVSGFVPNKLFLNPMDFAMLQGLKNQQGDYLMGPPTQDANNVRPWGLQVVCSSAITQGQFMVADTRMGASIFNRQGVTVEMYDQDANNVTENLVTIRAEARLAFAVERTACFVGGKLGFGA